MQIVHYSKLKNWIGWSLFSVESLLTCKVFVLKYWTQVLLCCVLLVKTPFYPSALQTGGVLSQFGRAGGCQTCETHIYVTAWQIFLIRSSVELSRPVVVHCHGHLPIWPICGLPMDQKLVKFGTNWVQTLRNAYLWKCVMDLAHLKFYGLVSSYSCALL